MRIELKKSKEVPSADGRSVSVYPIGEVEAPDSLAQQWVDEGAAMPLDALSPPKVSVLKKSTTRHTAESKTKKKEG